MNEHFMNSVDERYMTHYVLHSFLRALAKMDKNTNNNPDYVLPCFKEHKKVFDDSGLMTINNGIYYAVCGIKKGGLIKVYKSDKEVFCDFGYRHKQNESSKNAITNWLDPKYEILYKDNSFNVKGMFNLVGQKVQNPIYHLGLRVTSLIFGKKINTLIKKILLFSDKHENICFEREVVFEKNNITITDSIINKLNKEITIEEASNFSLRLVASGKFFSSTDLLKTEYNNFKINKSLTIKKKFDILSENLYYELNQER